MRNFNKKLNILKGEKGKHFSIEYKGALNVTPMVIICVFDKTQEKECKELQVKSGEFYNYLWSVAHSVFEYEKGCNLVEEQHKLWKKYSRAKSFLI